MFKNCVFKPDVNTVQWARAAAVSYTHLRLGIFGLLLQRTGAWDLNARSMGAHGLIGYFGPTRVRSQTCKTGPPNFTLITLHPSPTI